MTDATALPAWHDARPRVPVASTPSAPEGEGVEDMTIAELKAYAADHDIDLGDASKKPEILAAITAAQD